MNLIERAKRICLAPAAEWLVIAPETTDRGSLYKGYVIPLAAIGPIATFIGLSLIGTSVGFGGMIRLPLLWGLTTAIVGYLLALAMVFVISLIIDALAPNFGGEKSPMQAFKLAAYAFTPAWLAAIFHVIPALGILAVLGGIYGLYVLYLGTMPLMRVPKDKAVGYTAVIVVCAIVVGIVVGAIVGAVSAMGLGMGGAFGGLGAMSSSSTRNQEASQAAAAIIAERELAAAAAARSAAVQSTPVSPANNAMASGAAAAATAAAMQPLAVAEVVDQNVLKGLLPETVNGLPRTGFQAEKTGVAPMMVSKAEADYGDGAGTHVQLSITDLGGTQMVGIMAVWANLEEDKETDSGFEKTMKVAGRPVHETFQKAGASGEYATLVGQRFLVQANGTKVDMAALENAVTGLDLGKLDAMKTVGVKAAG